MTELVLKSNPVHKKIPVLFHGEKIICESLIILQYIDDVWSCGPQIHPSNPYDCAIARFWGAYIDDKLFPPLRVMAVGLEDDEVKVKEVDLIYESFGLLEYAYQKFSNGETFFGGDNIAYLDIVLGCNLGWVRAIEIMKNVKLIDEEKTPGLYKWSQYFLDATSVKDTIPETNTLLRLLWLL